VAIAENSHLNPYREAKDWQGPVFLPPRTSRFLWECSAGTVAGCYRSSLRPVARRVRGEIHRTVRFAARRGAFARLLCPVKQINSDPAGMGALAMPRSMRPAGCGMRNAVGICGPSEISIHQAVRSRGQIDARSFMAGKSPSRDTPLQCLPKVIAYSPPVTALKAGLRRKDGIRPPRIEQNFGAEYI
jgi:hypothetical protein